MNVRRVGWFIAVGSAAAAVHLATVVVLVRWGGWSPPAANVLGWLVAFVCSFFFSVDSVWYWRYCISIRRWQRCWRTVVSRASTGSE